MVFEEGTGLHDSTKVCGKCGAEKPLSEFGIDRHRKGGLNCWCKECCRNEYHIRKSKDPVGFKAKRAKTYKRYYELNREKITLRAREWIESNPERVNEVRRDRETKIRSTGRGRLDNAIKVSISQSLRRGAKAGSKWESLVGYDVDDLMAHLERHFTDGMSWENYGEWHVDHIIPKAALNYSEPEHIDFKRCWSLSNLQPLWATDNISKGGKLDAPFQPCLPIPVPF